MGFLILSLGPQQEPLCEDLEGMIYQYGISHKIAKGQSIQPTIKEGHGHVIRWVYPFVPRVLPV